MARTGYRLLARRCAAYLLDIVMLFAVLAPTALLIELALDLVPRSARQIWIAALLSFSIPVWFYFVAADQSRAGATLGKQLLKVRVVAAHAGVAADAAGRVTFARAVLRTAIKLLPWELAHVVGFALADAVGAAVQTAGLIAANVFAGFYLVWAVLTAGRQSAHDALAGARVREENAGHR